MIRKVPLTIARGFCMGAADIVPGVSGGTVALVLGIYHRLITNVKTGADALGSFAKLDLRVGVDRLRSVEWVFLLPLLGGIGLAVVSLAHVLEDALLDHPVEMAALFLGLIGGSIFVAWQLLEKRDAARVLTLAVTGVAVFLLLGLRSGTSEDSVNQIGDPAIWAFFLAGAIAICAMILPGVSGSFLLVMLGMYGPVLAAVNDRDVTSIAVFLVGAVLGLAVFSQLLHWALSAHYDTVMALLIGLMLGSMRVLWPWPNGTNTTELGAPDDPVVVPVLLAIGGLAVVVVVYRLAETLEGRSDEDLAGDVQAS